MKMFSFFFFLCLYFSLNAQKSTKSQIEILNKTRLRLESEIKIRQDSLKLVNQKIDLITQKEFLNKLKDQPEGMVIKAIISGPGKIRKENNPVSIVLDQVNISDTVLLTDYIDGYWVVNRGKYFGYINEVFIKNSPDLIAFKNSLIARQERMRLQIEEKKRIRDIAASKKYKEDQLKSKEVRRNNLINKYGNVIAEKLISGSYWMGMSSEMARESLGYPETINKSVGAWGINEQWVYYNLYLYFENGILTSYQTSR